MDWIGLCSVLRPLQHSIGTEHSQMMSKSASRVNKLEQLCVKSQNMSTTIKTN